MARSKNIVIVSHYYPPHVGGIEYVCYNQAQELAKQGHDVTVVTSKVSRNEASGKQDGVLVRRVSAWNPLQKFGVPFPLFGPRLISETKLAVQKADVVHIHDALYLSSLTAAVWAWVYRKPLVVTQHVGVVLHPSKLVGLVQNIAYQTVGRFVFNRANAVLTLNDAVEQLVRDLGVDEPKLSSTVNGVDPKLFQPARIGAKHILRKRFGLSQEKKIVLFVGRLVPKKGYKYVLANSACDYQLVFAGGETSLPSTENVKFLGPLSQDELSLVYRAADLFVLPSTNEGFPMSVQEAMASGLPVIMSDESGYRRYGLDSKSVKLLKKVSNASVGKSIREILSDDELRFSMSRYSIAYARNNFSWPKLATTLDELYDKLLKPKRQLIVTTSWDDGHKLDIRLANLLEKYNIPGTFYVSPRDREFLAKDRLSDTDIETLANKFEIGAHTLSHPRLTKVPASEAQAEIVKGKAYLEKLLGKPVTSFCYPGGAYNRQAKAMVQGAGFTYARTVRRYDFGKNDLGLEARTTVNAYNHWSDLLNIAKFARFSPVKAFQYFQWDRLAIAMFDRSLGAGGTYHLWGHSWEIDKHNDWRKLENVLKHISGRPNVKYVTNGGIAESKPRKLVMVAPYFPPHLGGQEFYAYNIGRALQDKFGWDVTIISSGVRGFRARKRNFHGLKVYELPYWLKISNTPINPWWLIMLRRIFKHQQPALILAHAPVAGMSDLAVRVAGNTPCILTYHMASMKKGEPKIDWLIKLYEERILPQTLAMASHVICASDVVEQTFMSDYGSKSTVVTPGVDTSFFTPARHRTENAVLFVGSLDKTASYKGLSYLLKAFKEVTNAVPGAHLNIIGNGDGRTQYEVMAKKLGIANHINFLGGVYGEELKDAYRKASVFVLPSLIENFPLTVAEAMSSGLPVIATNVGALTRMVEDNGTGYIVPPASSKAISEKIIYLLTNGEVAARLGARGRRKAVKELDWAGRAELTNRLLEAHAGVVAEAVAV